MPCRRHRSSLTNLFDENSMEFFDSCFDYLRPTEMFHHKYWEYSRELCLLEKVHSTDPTKRHRTATFEWRRSDRMMDYLYHDVDIFVQIFTRRWDGFRCAEFQIPQTIFHSATEFFGMFFTHNMESMRNRSVLSLKIDFFLSSLPHPGQWRSLFSSTYHPNGKIIIDDIVWNIIALLFRICLRTEFNLPSIKHNHRSLRNFLQNFI